MIVVSGEALIDLVIQPDGSLRAVPGGGPFNTARTIGRLGVAAAFLGRLSRDRFGGFLRGALIDDSVDVSMAEPTDAPTTLAMAELDDEGIATYRFHTAETASPELSHEAVVTALATRPAAFHLGTLGLVLEPIAAALEAGMATADEATVVMLDPNCRPLVIRDRAAHLARIRRVAARADIVKVSTDDLDWLEPGQESVAAAQALLKRGPRVVLITDGPGDARIVTRDEVVAVPVLRVGVVDTVGAGDAFGGGFLARWIERGLGRADLDNRAALRDAVEFAVEVAALTCQRTGADPPRRAELASLR
ncbi:MAG: PfkB family carbohydrate kinase [Chloroflexota bacterium]